jgi:hypothetical protein
VRIHWAHVHKKSLWRIRNIQIYCTVSGGGWRSTDRKLLPYRVWMTRLLWFHHDSILSCHSWGKSPGKLPDPTSGLCSDMWSRKGVPAGRCGPSGDCLLGPSGSCSHVSLVRDLRCVNVSPILVQEHAFLQRSPTGAFTPPRSIQGPMQLVRDAKKSISHGAAWLELLASWPGQRLSLSILSGPSPSSLQEQLQNLRDLKSLLNDFYFLFKRNWKGMEETVIVTLSKQGKVDQGSTEGQCSDYHVCALWSSEQSPLYSRRKGTPHSSSPWPQDNAQSSLTWHLRVSQVAPINFYTFISQCNTHELTNLMPHGGQMYRLLTHQSSNLGSIPD